MNHGGLTHDPYAASLKRIAAATQAWGNDRFRDGTTPAGVSDKAKRLRSPDRTYELLTRELRRIVLSEVRATLQLERCAVVVPVRGKAGFWTPIEHEGIPASILHNSIYSLGEGLTGLVLQGKRVISDDVLLDPRRSTKYGDKWIPLDDAATEQAIPRTYIGEPLWIQLSDASLSSTGAVYGVRPERKFSPTETEYFQQAAHLLSLGQDRLRSWKRRSETDLRQLKISQIWDLPLSDCAKYKEVLKLLKQEFHFERLLLSVVDEDKHHMDGVATIGFRNDLVTDTSRIIHSEGNPDEDILAWMYRTKARRPRLISPEDEEWRKVHPITAFRHQVNHPLLLIPMWGSAVDPVGVVLAEAPAFAMNFTRQELHRISLFVNHAGSLIQNHRTVLSHRGLSAAWSRIHSILFDPHSATPHQDQFYPVSEMLAEIARFFRFDRAVLYRFEEEETLLQGIAGFGVPWKTVTEHSVRVTLGDVNNDDSSFAEACLRSQDIRRIDVGNISKKDASVLPTFRESQGGQLCGVRILHKGICRGLLQFVSSLTGKSCENACERLLSSFLSAVAHLLVNIESQHIARQTRRASSAYQSLALAIDEIGKPEIGVTGFRPTVAFHSILRDTASVFDAALSQVFLCEPGPVQIRRDEQQLANAVSEVTLVEFARHVDTSSEFRKLGRVLMKDGGEQRRINVGHKKGLTSAALKTLKPVVSPDVENDPFWSGQTLELSGPRAFLGVPLVCREDSELIVYGVLTVTRLRRSPDDLRHFTLEDQQSALSIASLLSSALWRRDEFERTQRVDEQVRRCLRWFRHDIPSMIEDIEQSSHRCCDCEGDDLRKNVEELALLAESTRAVFVAAALVLGDSGKARSEPGIERIRENLGDYVVSIGRLRRQLEVLLRSERARGDTIVNLDDGLDSDAVIRGVWSKPLLYCAYALLQNAMVACFQNKERTTAENPGHVVMTISASDSQVALVVTDDAGGVGGKPLNELTQERYSNWDKKFSKHASGMGLFIVSRLVRDILQGNLTLNEIQIGDRRGSRFQVTLPLSNDTTR